MGYYVIRNLHNCFKVAAAAIYAPSGTMCLPNQVTVSIFWDFRSPNLVTMT
jgi:hypothetical protein